MEACRRRRFEPARQGERIERLIERVTARRARTTFSSGVVSNACSAASMPRRHARPGASVRPTGRGRALARPLGQRTPSISSPRARCLGVAREHEVSGQRGPPSYPQFDAGEHEPHGVKGFPLRCREPVGSNRSPPRYRARGTDNWSKRCWTRWKIASPAPLTASATPAPANASLSPARASRPSKARLHSQPPQRLTRLGRDFDASIRQASGLRTLQTTARLCGEALHSVGASRRGKEEGEGGPCETRRRRSAKSATVLTGDAADGFSNL